PGARQRRPRDQPLLHRGARHREGVRAPARGGHALPVGPRRADADDRELLRARPRRQPDRADRVQGGVTAMAPSDAGPALLDLAAPAAGRPRPEPRRLGRERPPVALPPGGERIVLRYADVEALSSDPRIASNAVPIVTRHGVRGGALLGWWRRMLTNQ